MSRLILYWLFYTFFFSSLYAQEIYHERAHVIIFVHGAISIKPYLTLPNFIRLISGNIENSVYEQSVVLMRNNPFFFQNQPMQELGLCSIPAHDNLQAGAPLFAKLFDTVLSQYSTKKADRYYYTGGWRGLLNTTARYQDACVLYTQIRNELFRLQQQGYKTIKITLIGYSHGGNICLSLAAAHAKYNPHENFTIDEFISLGTPVQSETDYLIQSPIFKEIYHFYSYADKIQCLDCFSLKRFFSQRYFVERKNISLPVHLSQINVLITDQVMRLSKRGPPKAKKAKLHTIDRSPGHMELWFYGWTPLYFRQDFPLYPVPLVLLIPFFIAKLKEYNIQGPDITLDLHWHTQGLYIKKATSKQVFITSFIATELLEHLKKSIHSIRPFHFTNIEYEYHVNQAIKSISKQKLCTCHRQQKRTLCRSKKEQAARTVCLL